MQDMTSSAFMRATFVREMLRDCRQCRTPDGCCSIDDGFRQAFLDGFLPADGFIAATPVYWYGMSAQLKAFYDRMFCYIAASYPGSGDVVPRMTGKRIGLLLSSRRHSPWSVRVSFRRRRSSRATRVAHSSAWVHGIGNARGDVAKDPGKPLDTAYRFGAEFFTRHATDYQIDTPAPPRVFGVRS